MMTKLCDAEPRKILELMIAERTGAILSYTSRDKWHATDVMPVRMGANCLYFEIAPHKKSYPMNISIGQQVGISVKYDYGKIIFESTVISLEPSPNKIGGGIVVVETPATIKTVSRRNYFRVAVPKSLDIKVEMRRHGQHRLQDPKSDVSWEGELVDISAGGLQVALEASNKPPFKEGQFVDLAFCPLNGQAVLKFKALTRCVLPTADERSLCIGMQMVGLEASPEGRKVLQRICEVVEVYHRMNHSEDKQWSFLDGN